MSCQNACQVETTLTLREFSDFPKRKMRLATLILTALPLAVVYGGELIPTADGTSWRYNMTEEIGKGLDIRNTKTDADGKIRLPVLYRIDGTENVDGKDLLKFEMHRAGAITNTDLLAINEQGIICWAWINLDGQFIKFNPPQTMIANPLRTAASLDFNGQAGELTVRQHYDVVGEEDIEVPAGKFYAGPIHGEQTSPSPMAINPSIPSSLCLRKDVTTIGAPNARL